MKKSIFTILSITILILAWQLLTMLVRLPELVPSIPHLFSTLVALFASGSFYQSVMATVLRGTIGMSISLMAAMGVSLLFYKCEWIYELFRPLLAIMRSIPVISFILLALIFLNAESIPLIIAFLTMFPLLTENLTKGIRGQRKEFSIMARQFRIGRWNKLAQVSATEAILIQRSCICFGLWLACYHYGRGTGAMFARYRRGNETGTSFYSRSRIDRMDDYSNSDQLSF